jgi:hypothetical protein
MKNNKAIQSKTKDFTIQVKFSKEAVEKKLIKFITKKHKDEIIISSDDLINVLVNQVNMDTLAPTFVDTEKINTVEVSRQLKCVLDKDMKKGQEIRLNYIHPYPLEFALIEEAWKIAKIEKGAKGFEITNEMLDKAKKSINPMNEGFLKKAYAAFKGLSFGK